MSSGHLRTMEIGGGKFLPAASGGEAVQPEQGSAVNDGVTDLHHTSESDQLCFIDFIAPQQFDVVAKVAQEPVELPQSLGIAEETAGNDVVGKSPGFENGEGNGVIRFLCLPTKLDSLHPNEEESIGDLVRSAPIRGMEACDLAFHAAPSFWPR